MTTNIKVVRKIVVNGVEYHALEEMPPDVRAKYDKAVGTELQSRVTLNGQQYDSFESLPPDLRKIVGDAVETGRPTGRLVAALVVIIAVLVAVIGFLLRSR